MEPEPYLFSSCHAGYHVANTHSAFKCSAVYKSATEHKICSCACHKEAADG